MTMLAIDRPDADLPDERTELIAAGCLFRGLGDPGRLAILRHLASRERRVVELTEYLGLAQSTVSRHLACLRDCGLVESRPVGRASMFALTQPELVSGVLAAAEQLLVATGEAARSCSVYGEESSP